MIKLCKEGLTSEKNKLYFQPKIYLRNLKKKKERETSTCLTPIDQAWYCFWGELTLIFSLVILASHLHCKSTFFCFLSMLIISSMSKLCLCSISSLKFWMPKVGKWIELIHMLYNRWIQLLNGSVVYTGCWTRSDCLGLNHGFPLY